MATPKVWLITGASSGFGLELAKFAASKGDRVLAASRKPEKLKSLESTEKNIKAVRLDQNESAQDIKEAAKDILSVYGTVDIVVNNAAYVQTGTIEETTPEETLQQFQTNVFGPLNVYRAFLPHLREKGSGTLITIGSMAAWFSTPGGSLYNSSKAAIRVLSNGLRLEVAPFGIRHCLIEPGFFRTELLNPEANIGKTKETRLPAYEKLNAAVEKNFAAYNGNQIGDPAKGVEIIYDVVTSTGVAKGKELPEFLPLGSDASDVISNSASKVIAGVDEWRTISGLTDFPKQG